MEGRRDIGWAARDSSGLFSPYSFTLRETGPEDVGWTNTDLHQIRNEIHLANYPLVPGFVVRIPEKLGPEQAAPLLCAGVTAYSPLKQFRASNNALKAGILGLGGVGNLGVLIAKAMGHHVTIISSSDEKRVEALEDLGADAFLVGSNAVEMEQAANSLDYILDTVPAVHPLQSYLPLLKVDGKLIIVGVAPESLQFDSVNMILGKKTISGSFIGSIEETQKILEFWAEKDLTTMMEIVKMDYVNKAFERMERNDVRYRFVLDVAGTNLE